MPDFLLSQIPLSAESKAWLAAQANKQFDEPVFSPEDVIKIPRDDNQFDLYLINRTKPIGSGSNSQLYHAYPLSIDGVVSNQSPVAVKLITSEGYQLDMMTNRHQTKKDSSKRCTLSLMAAPPKDEFKKSDKSHLYLYKKEGCDLLLMPPLEANTKPKKSTRTCIYLYKENGKCFYRLGRKKITLDKPPDQLMHTEFKGQKCTDPAICNFALATGNFRKDDKYFYQWGGETHYIEDTNDISKQLQKAKFNNAKNEDKDITPLLSVTYAKGHTYAGKSQDQPEDKVIKIEATAMQIKYRVVEDGKEKTGEISRSDLPTDLPNAAYEILENKDKWLPILLAKTNENNASSNLRIR